MEIVAVNKLDGQELPDNIALPDGKYDYDLYQCYFCGRLITPEQEKAAFKNGVLCICGSVKYKPTKTVNAVQQEDGNYLITGTFGETYVMDKAVFEENYKAVSE